MQVLLAKKIIMSEGNIDNIDNLLHNNREQNILGEPDLTTITGKAAIILDFGKERYGGVRIMSCTVSDNIRCYVRLRFGESLGECCAEIGEKNANNHHSVRDAVIELVHSGVQTFGETGFRFLRMDFLTGNCIVGLKSVFGVVSEYENNNIIYQYEGKDEIIGKIYNTAKHTVDLCVQGNYVWDGIKRDKIVWIGDMYPEMLALTSIYGRVEPFEKSLEFVKRTTPEGGWMNRFPTYSLWFIIIICDYYKETNKLPFLENQIETIIGIIDLMDKCVLQNGELNYPSYFFDWPTHGTSDEIVGVRAINILACKKAIEIFNILNINTDKVQNILDRLLLIPLKVEKQKQVVAFKYLALGKITKEEKEIILSNGINGISTFMSYFIFETIAKVDSPNNAIKLMKEYYGAMLDKGATTFWEDFDISWTKDSCGIDEFPKDGEKQIHGDYGAHCYKNYRLSLCHGWSCGIIKIIKDYCR